MEGLMNRETIVEVPGLTLWYYPETRIIHHELLKYPGTSVLESALEKGFSVLRSHGARKWLSDDRRGGALPASHHEWGRDVWGPKMATAGWRYWALVPPNEALGSANMRRVAKVYADLGVTVETFGDLGSAMKWLVAQPG
jgi:hypothetical protein